ncbi:MAG: UDP-N-acetylmuramoyl-L-alanine--D-glutamate ligase [Deltaproteobacteria bacterium]|nr:UDP-N-acetylmuramoyl-L-alanine--D-glutamate ligase [Deltaproteobacteria bacterium]
MRIVVWGTGVTGRATAREMISQGHEVRLVDENTPLRQGRSASGGEDIPVKMVEAEDIKWADIVIPSPGIPKDHPILEYATRICSEIEVAYQLLSGKLIAVTGTNGKTTTVTLIYKILDAAGLNVAQGGNISPPLISLVGSAPEIVIAEISSFQLEWIERFKPYIAVCMNITPDHLDRYMGMEEYVTQKLRIFENQGVGDLAVINDNDTYLANIKTKAKIAGFALNKGKRECGAYIKDGRVWFYGEIEGKGPLIECAYPLGNGVIEDMLVSALVARLMGVDIPVMEDVFKKFKGIHHRMELVAEINGIKFIDDSKATNVGAVEKALSGLPSGIILILGGKDKGGDFSVVASQYKAKIKKAILIGQASKRIEREISCFVDVEIVSGMEEAVGLAYLSASPEDTVLLSPGCASFDMFESYAQRGESFVRCVKNLIKNKN